MRSVSYQYEADCSTLLLQTMSFLLRGADQKEQQLEEDTNRPTVSSSGDPSEKLASDCRSRILSSDGCESDCQPRSGEDSQTSNAASDGGPPTIEVTPDIKHFVESSTIKKSPTWSGREGEKSER